MMVPSNCYPSQLSNMCWNEQTYWCVALLNPFNERSEIVSDFFHSIFLASDECHGVNWPANNQGMVDFGCFGA